jgi:hypothetical protein
MASTGPTSSLAPSPGPSAQAAQAALAAYRGFRAAQVKAGATGHVKGSGVEQYAFDNALSGVEADILLFQQQGIVMRGQPLLSPRVIAVDLSGAPAVTLVDCVDVSHWIPVFAKTGKSAVASGQASRTVVDVAVGVSDSRWKVRSLVDHRDRTC